MLKYALVAAVACGCAGAAFAADASQFVIIKDKNQNCRVVEKNLVSEDELTQQVGKQAYPSWEEANIDLKVV
ncbi:MAG TPA: hypothetical protein VNJ31_08855, partial [Methyloceanibacter sp.]|nr:hypothetical protein [Methyloceanibacter sp.]